MRAISYADLTFKQKFGILRAGTHVSLERIRSLGDDDDDIY